MSVLFEFARNVLAVIGALVVSTFAAGALLMARQHVREARARRLPLPGLDLPPISPAEYERLYADMERFEKGERP